MNLKYLVLIIVYLIIIQRYFSQKTSDSIKIQNLQEVEISANRVVEKKRLTAQQINLLTKEEIQFLQSQTTADLMQNSGSVFVQKSQQGGGSPVIRGFESSRILLVIDGVRMNNLIYRSGHLQNIITTDNNSFEKVEIIYGSSSTIYGSDALGGVIHLYTRNPVLANDSQTTKIKVNLFTRYGSVNNESTSHVDFNIGFKKFASFTSFTFSRFGDLRGGENQNPFYNGSYGERPYYVKRFGNKDSMVKNSDKYLQVQSGYNQYDLVQKFLFKQNDFTEHLLNFQYSTSSNVPRYDRLTEYAGTNLRFAEWYYGPQTRLMAAYDFKYSKSTFFSDFIRVIANFQNIEESRYTRRFNNKNLNGTIENVNVYGLNVDLLKKWNKHHLQYGIDVQYNTVSSKGIIKDIIANVENPGPTRYPDGSNKMMWGAFYLTHKWFLDNESLILIDGVRLGYAYLHSTFIDTTFFKFPFRESIQRNFTYSGNIGIVNNIKNEWKLSFLVSSGFRVPNVDDLGKVFDTQPGAVIVPNPNIQPEKTLTEEINVTKFFGNNGSFENVIYYTQIFDAIVTDKFQYNGQDSIIYNGVKSQVLANQNKQRAYIYGFASQLRMNVSHHFEFAVSMNYTYGRIKTDTMDYPLDHIPPFYSRMAFSYKPNAKLNFTLFSIFNGKKDVSNYNMFGEDNFKYATPVGIPAWFTLNFRMQWNVWKYATLVAGIDNIFDTQYRVFASGINAPGRNIFATLKIHF
ncbi:MAG: hypothetical protein KatS3mg027_0184 [Bacteroidia bacterium]|nr:MAG: hypothetical protein KatS3mg027_0184 [Bacteroidia bacterium]